VAAEERKRFEMDLDSFRAGFLANLQQLQDHLKACHCGLEALTAEQYDAPFFRGGPLVYPPAELGYEQAKDFARFWLTRSFFRDVIDFINDYLDHCFDKCHFTVAAKSGRDEWIAVHRRRLSSFHKLGMPDKFACLIKEFEVRTEWERQVLSINNVRNCLVHRLGKVREPDCREGQPLELVLRRLITYPPGKGSGNWQKVTLSKRDLQYEDAVTRFSKGDHVRFDLDQLNDCLYTMLLFEDSMREALFEYFVRMGANVTRTLGDPRLS
jgi:hypothetical protein